MRDGRARCGVSGWGLVLAAVLAPLVSGCRVMAHATERLQVERRRSLAQETLSETWEPARVTAIRVERDAGGLRVTAEGVERGTRRVRERFTATLETRCARRAVGGIFEAPDSFWGVADDVWVGTAFVGMFLLRHVWTDDPEVLAVFVALAVGPMLVDVVTFIPFWIAGHDWSGACDYCAGREDLGERTEERDEELERGGALAAARIRVDQEGRPGDPLATLAADAEGSARLRPAEIARWSLGHGGDLLLSTEAGGASAVTRVAPGVVLNGPHGDAVDWRAPRGGAEPALAATTRLEGSELVVRFRNSGPGDAWQVAAIVASENPEDDGRLVAVGRVAAGETVEARLPLSDPGPGAVDFTEAFGRAPGALPFGH